MQSLRLGAGGIFQTQLHLGAAIPCVQFQPAREVEPLMPRLHQRGAEGAVEGPEGHGFQRGACAIAEAEPEVGFPHPAGAQLASRPIFESPFQNWTTN